MFLNLNFGTLNLSSGNVYCATNNCKMPGNMYRTVFYRKLIWITNGNRHFHTIR